MNHYVLHHNNNNIGLATLEDGNNLDQNKGNVICPKPTRPLRWNKYCQQSEYSNANAGEELLGIIENNEYSFSPPSYLLGSPPVRASNPLIQDAQFGCEKEKQHIPAQSIISSSSPSPLPGLSSSSSSSSSTSAAALSPSSPLRKGGCVRMKFGIKSAKVRVVGFDCNFPGVAY